MFSKKKKERKKRKEKKKKKKSNNFSFTLYAHNSETKLYRDGILAVLTYFNIFYKSVRENFDFGNFFFYPPADWIKIPIAAANGLTKGGRVIVE